MSQQSQPAVVKNSLGWRKFVAPKKLCFVVNSFFGCIFMLFFCVKVQGNKGQRFFSSVLIVHFVYSLEITTICCNISFAEIYALFGVNSFSPEIRRCAINTT